MIVSTHKTIHFAISFQDIDLKGLLYEAYHKSSRELLYVVPFTAKVLESCAKSKVCNTLFYLFRREKDMHLHTNTYLCISIW